ncbi:hypothetical protein [Haladaptatus sp. CMSO5]|uniref:hypothetical protein n=1 Tax=Haladaptatus sp. CMSO5 TaxID=3120514 RepID=UPI002FCDF8DE
MAVGSIGDRQIRMGNIVGLSLITELVFVEVIFMFLFLLVRNPDGLSALANSEGVGVGDVLGLFSEPVLAVGFALFLVAVVIGQRLVREFARAYDLEFLRRRPGDY